MPAGRAYLMAVSRCPRVVIGPRLVLSAEWTPANQAAAVPGGRGDTDTLEAAAAPALPLPLHLIGRRVEQAEQALQALQAPEAPPGCAVPVAAEPRGL